MKEYQGMANVTMFFFEKLCENNTALGKQLWLLQQNGIAIEF
jgi:hypothetical protein